MAEDIDIVKLLVQLGSPIILVFFTLSAVANVNSFSGGAKCTMVPVNCIA